MDVYMDPVPLPPLLRSGEPRGFQLQGEKMISERGFGSTRSAGLRKGLSRAPEQRSWLGRSDSL